MPNVPSNDARAPLPSAKSAAPQAFGWLCDNAMHRFWVQNNGAWFMHSPSAGLVTAWQVSWLTLDLMSAPANSLPELRGQAQAWPPALIEAIHAEAGIPPLTLPAWQALRRARDAGVFDRLPEQPSRLTAVPHKTLALELRYAFNALGLEALGKVVTPELLAAFEVILAASLWAVETLPETDRASLPELMALVLQHIPTLAAAHPNDARPQLPKLRLEGRSQHQAFGAPARAPVPKAVRRGDEVQFTVYRPNQLAPSRWSKLLAFAHLAQRRPDAPPGTPDPIAQVHDQAHALLGSELQKYRQLSEDSGQPIPFEGQLTFIPEVQGVKFDPPRASILWVDDVQRVEFRMRPSARLAGRSARGQLSVYCGSILVAELQLTLRVAASADHESQAMAPPESTRMYRKIFASYSHADTEIVTQFRELAKAFGDRYLVDVSELRAGERWSSALEQLIREADVFQLFWSWSSMRSEFVRREWEYALQLGRPSFVRPTFWEQPMPAVPGEDLPPAHLAALHFHALSVSSGSAAPALSPAPAPANSNASARPLGHGYSPGSAREPALAAQGAAMDHSFDQITHTNKPAGFVPFTAFPGLEHAIERQLGQESKYQLSEEYRRSFVRYLPWVALLMLPLQLGGVMLVLGMSMLANLFGSGSLVPALISTGAFVLDAIALPGLFSNTRKGWAFFTYAILLSALGKALTLSLFGLLVSALLVWVAFQIKYHYR